MPLWFQADQDPCLFIFAFDKLDQIPPSFELICSNLFLSLHITFSPNQICSGMCSSKCWWFFKKVAPPTRATKKIINSSVPFYRKSYRYFVFYRLYRKWLKFSELVAKVLPKVLTHRVFFVVPLIISSENLYPSPFVLTHSPLFLQLRVLQLFDFSLQN